MQTKRLKTLLCLGLGLCLLVSMCCAWPAASAENEEDYLQLQTVFDFSTQPGNNLNFNTNPNAAVTSDPGCFAPDDATDPTDSALKIEINNRLVTGGAENAYAKYAFLPGNDDIAQQPPIPFSGDGIRLWLKLIAGEDVTQMPIGLKIAVTTGYTGGGTGVEETTYITEDLDISKNGGYFFVPYSALCDEKNNKLSILTNAQGTSTAEDRIAAITSVRVQFVAPDWNNASLANYPYLYLDNLQCYTDATKTTPGISSAPRTTGGYVDLTGTRMYSDVQTGTGSVRYVSQSRGDDANPGTKEQPFKTIAKANEGISAGDTVIVESGIYNENLVYYQKKGTAAQPITLMGAPGANVTITSYDPVDTQWTLYRDHIYKTNIGADREITHALLKANGGFNNLLEARWPNADAQNVLDMPRAVADDGTSTTQIFDADLPDGDWTGGTVVAWTGAVTEQYTSAMREIAAYEPGVSLTFDSAIDDGSTTYQTQKGDWYYMQGALAGLDAQREYYYDKQTGDLYVILPDNAEPQAGDVWVETRGATIENWDSDYLQFANLNIVGGGVGINGNYCTMDNVNVYYADFYNDKSFYDSLRIDYNGNHLKGDHNSWKNSEIAYTMSSGIFIDGSYNTIENCVIHDIAYGGSYNGAVSLSAENRYNTVRSCSLYNSGRFLIHFLYDDTRTGSLDGNLFEYNDMSRAGLLTNDGGAFYSYKRDGGGTIIRYNWVHDCMKTNTCGIYLDNDSSNFVVYRNVVWGTKEAPLALNLNSLNNKIFNNTILSYDKSAEGWPKENWRSMAGTELVNNLFTGTVDLLSEKNGAPAANLPEYRSNCITDLPQINRSFFPLAGSELIDAGEVMTGYDDTYVGDAPDIGAYEFGGNYWIPGAVKVESDDPEQSTDPTASTQPEQPTESTEQPTESTSGSTSATDPTEPAVLYGDVNGDEQVDSRDSLRLRQYIAKYPVTLDQVAADVNADGKINSRDSLLLRQCIAKYDVTLGPKE